MKIQRLKSYASAVIPALIAFAAMPVAAMPVHNVPNAVAIAHYEGRVDPVKEMNLTIVLKLHNQADYDKAYDDLYDPASSRYHQWFTAEDFEKYAPTKAEYETVRGALEKEGFTVVSSDPLRFSIRVHGTAAIVEKAFHTELDNFSYNGRTFQAHIRDAHLSGPADDLIEGVSGLERHEARPQLSIIRNPLTGEPAVKIPLTTKESLAQFPSSVTDQPLSVSATTPFTSFGQLPTASYTGIQYAANGKMGAFTPKQLKAHYGIPFTQGAGKSAVTYDGTGQTIALVEGYGYPDIETDANEAATLFGLPKFTASSLSIVYPEGQPLNPNAGVISGWDGEIALDVQSAHAMAPGAKILVVASSGQDNEDQLNSLNYIFNGGHPRANVVSSSWENDSEILSGRLEESAFTNILSAGAHAGIAFQFSSGDGGDLGLGTPVGDVMVPANSPYVTAVGGTSILNDPYKTGSWIVTGWGNNQLFLYDVYVEDPVEGYYRGGAGGGESQYFTAASGINAKPSWQRALGANGRLVPDIAALADPFTGFTVVLTSNGKQNGEVVGGTSLACPIFSAIWAVADQYEGKPLGQAAPKLYKLSSTEINDVVPPTSAQEAHDLTGSITDMGGTHPFTRTTLFTDATDLNTGGSLPLYSQADFLSANWPKPFGDKELDYAVSFGTDSSLTVTSGWDDVTGLGEPNGMLFIQGVTGKTTGAGEKKE
jgi:subtilase family serine protease